MPRRLGRALKILGAAALCATAAAPARAWRLWPWSQKSPTPASASTPAGRPAPGSAAQAAAIVNDPRYYSGKFFTACAELTGAAEQGAKVKAIGDLMEQIQVKVTSRFQDITGFEASSSRPDRYKKSVSQYVASYVHLQLSGINSIPFVENWPRKGQCAVIAYISRADADRQIQEQAAKDREKVASKINTASAALSKGEYAAALQSYVNASAVFHGIFQGMPVIAPLQEGASPVDYGQAIALGLNGLLSSIRLNPVSSSIRFTAQGRLQQPARVAAVYSAPGAAPQPVPRLPLAAALWGGGSAYESVSAATDDNGLAEFSLSQINARYPHQRLSVTLDTQTLPGLSPDQLPACQIRLGRLPTVAYGVWVRINGRRSSLFGFGDKLSGALSSVRLMAADLGRLKSRNCADSAIEEAARSAPADYVLSAWVLSNAVHVASLDVDGARARSGFFLCRVSDGKAVPFPGPSARGMGSDLSSAGAQAAAKAADRLAARIPAALSRLDEVFR